MKKIVSAILVCVLVLCSALTLVSCADVDKGVYVSSAGTELEFSKKNCTVKYVKDGVAEEKSYTYEVKDNKTNPDKQEISFTADGETIVFTYEKLEDGIAINGIKYNKK